MNTACIITQSFGGHSNPLYVGVKGHTGIDNSCGYGTTITSYWTKEFIYKRLDKQNPSNDGSGFTGLFTIVDNGIETFEFLYGHGNPTIPMNQSITKGTPISTEANNGLIYAGQTQITLAMQKVGDQRGAHRHDQKRPLKKVRVTTLGKKYITGQDGGWYRDDFGYYYEIVNYDNGYNGCVDWTLPLFNRDLFVGCQGYDVLCLQRYLKWQGFFDIDPTGYFGTLTQQSVVKLQDFYLIEPSRGYFGPKSRALANAQYEKV